jgi:hypothetical protein
LSYQPVNIIDPRMSKALTAVALHLNRRLWAFTALNSALTQFWCSIMDS